MYKFDAVKRCFKIKKIKKPAKVLQAQGV